MPVTILAIESSCDDTSAAVVRDGYLLSNLIATQEVHKLYGGVVPELASRAHQANIIPVVDQAMIKAGVTSHDIDAVAFTRGPGLLGSLLVGTSFAKGFSIARNIPIIQINHLHAHVLAHWIKEDGKEKRVPQFPFLCLLVSGGHTQLLIVKDHAEFEEIGSTIDDAAGEAFDKCGKVLGLPYPGGPVVDKLASDGDPQAYRFTKPKIKGLDYSFSGLKTNFLYFLRDSLKKESNFIDNNINDLCASIQFTIIDILMDKLIKASAITGITEVGIAGGVAANSGLRKALIRESKKRKWNIFIPDNKFTTDNAAMIAITGYFKYLKKDFSDHTITPLARFKV